MRFIRRLRDSFCERARHFSQSCKAARLLEQEGIVGPWEDSYELLQTVLSIRAILPEVPPVLVDVGAHRGAFARAADRVLGFEQILCIEPDSDLVAELRRAAPGGKTAVRQLALSDTEGAAELFIHGDRSMNSLLRADSAILEQKFPKCRSGSIGSREVRTARLDTVLMDENLLDGRGLLLKLDTQGNELDILRCGELTMQNTAACLVEFMFCSPYATSYSFQELVDFFGEHGLDCCGALSIFRRRSHEVSGVDFLFIRRTVRIDTRR